MSSGTPGGGPWFLDLSHWPRPVHRLYAELYPVGAATGMRASAERWGTATPGAVVFVDGFGYVGRGEAAADTDPDALADAADRAWAERRWLADLEEWDTTVKPAAVSSARRLLQVDPESLEPHRRARYLRACCEHLVDMVAAHHRFTGSALTPLGDFLAKASDWTGLPASQLLAVFDGTSAVSTGDGPEVRAAAAALSDDREAAAVLESDVDAATGLEALRAWAPPVGTALDTYLDVVGHRLVGGFDLGSPTLMELPHLLVTQLRSVLDRRGSASRADEAAVAVRDAVPSPKRRLFDAAVDDVRPSYRLRDERGVYTDVLAAGILRHALLAIGHCLVEEGRLLSATDLFEATPRELDAVASGEDGPSPGDLRARTVARLEKAPGDAPFVLGPAGAPGATEGAQPVVRPPSAGQERSAAAMAAIGPLLFGGGASAADPSAPAAPRDGVRGIPASPGVHVGRARVVLDPISLGDLVEGEVLVMPSTTEAIAAVAPFVGAIVTDHGGAVSHAAIFARECGVPAVVGCGEATRIIRDGDVVRVDGSAGTVGVDQPTRGEVAPSAAKSS